MRAYWTCFLFFSRWRRLQSIFIRLGTHPQPASCRGQDQQRNQTSAGYRLLGRLSFQYWEFGAGLCCRQTSTYTVIRMVKTISIRWWWSLRYSSCYEWLHLFYLTQRAKAAIIHPQQTRMHFSKRQMPSYSVFSVLSLGSWLLSRRVRISHGPCSCRLAAI